ncbi:MAG: hypothetical protein PHG66_01055 [Candidatus Colwellbacteria bacterium]|nr:hypothetical protein [Candidatus Colwellbacteria bacterium]
MSKLIPERGSFSKAPVGSYPTCSNFSKAPVGYDHTCLSGSNFSRPEFYPSARAGMGTQQGFLYSSPGVDIIHNDDLEEIVIHTPPMKSPPQVRQIINDDSYCSSKVMIGNVKFPLSIFIILATILTALSICAIIIHDRYSNTTCIGSYSGIVFGYVKWLYIYAWTNIGLIGCMCWLFIISRFSSIKVDSLKLNILRLGYLFQFAWYIVGAVLYFIEINESCSSGDILYDFGLALFICQTVVWFTILFQDRTT